MKKLLTDKRCYFLLSIVGVFIFSINIQTNAQTGTGGGCQTTQISYPHNYKAERPKVEDCSYCVTNNGGVGVAVFNHQGQQIGINYSRAKQTISASTVACTYLPNDPNAYCTQVLISGGVVDCTPIFVPLPGYTGTAPGPTTGAGGTGGSTGTTTGTGLTGTGTGGH